MPTDVTADAVAPCSVARMMVEVIVFLGDAWRTDAFAEAVNGRPHYRTISLDGLTTSVQGEVDAVFLRATTALLAAPSAQLWSLLAMLPFQFVSADGAWRILMGALPNRRRWRSDGRSRPVCSHAAGHAGPHARARNCAPLCGMCGCGPPDSPHGSSRDGAPTPRNGRCPPCCRRHDRNYAGPRWPQRHCRNPAACMARASLGARAPDATCQRKPERRHCRRLVHVGSSGGPAVGWTDRSRVPADGQRALGNQPSDTRTGPREGDHHSNAVRRPRA